MQNAECRTTPRLNRTKSRHAMSGRLLKYLLQVMGAACAPGVSYVHNHVCTAGFCACHAARSLQACAALKYDTPASHSSETDSNISPRAKSSERRLCVMGVFLLDGDTGPGVWRRSHRLPGSTSMGGPLASWLCVNRFVIQKTSVGHMACSALPFSKHCSIGVRSCRCL